MLQMQLELQPGKSRVQLNSKTPHRQPAAHWAARTKQQVPPGGCASVDGVNPGESKARAKANVSSRAFLMMHLLGVELRKVFGAARPRTIDADLQISCWVGGRLMVNILFIHDDKLLATPGRGRKHPADLPNPFPPCRSVTAHPTRGN